MHTTLSIRGHQPNKLAAKLSCRSKLNWLLAASCSRSHSAAIVCAHSIVHGDTHQALQVVYVTCNCTRTDSMCICMRRDCPQILKFDATM